MVELRNNFENLVLHDSHGVHLKIIEGPRSTGCHFAPCHFKSELRTFIKNSKMPNLPILNGMEGN